MAFFVVIFALVFLAGCASTHGNKKIGDAETLNKIKVGVSTKDEVRALLGEPGTVDFDLRDNEIWRYAYVRSDTRGTTFIPYVGALIGGSDTKTVNVTVKFNNSGIVKNIGKGGSKGGAGGLQDLGS